MVRRPLVFALALCLVSLCGFAAPVDPPITLKSDSSILLDAATGQVLAHKNPDEPYVASGAIKVMTMLLVFEAIEQGHLALSEGVQISQNAAGQDGTQAFLDAGASYKAEELVKVMCMASANDAAVALAERIFGSEEVFVAKMNERAKALGCTKTVFDNLTGLQTKSTTTTRDLALIAAALCQKAQVFAYTSIYLYTLRHQSGRETELVNTNRLVRFYANCDGLATGSSGSSLYAGVFTAKRSDLRLIAVTLCAPSSDSRFEDAKTLLNYGFANFVSRTLVRKGEVLKKGVPVKGGRPERIDIVCPRDVRVVMLRGEEKQLKKELVLPEIVDAPVTVNQQVGVLRVSKDDELLMEIPVVALFESRALNFWEIVMLLIRCWLCGRAAHPVP